ncbi:unnamed protein product [Nezara viridula]|uniref:Uncharacterized protein n=1 Tax=Nezara viridula TaxID=85310 RepID=A0A9P0E7J3_NEZVI|nr:unnamed protein product [Nezara viridula]
MGDDRKARWLLEARPERRRPQGRPRSMNADLIERIGTVRGSTMPEMRRLAQVRDLPKNGGIGKKGVLK